MGCACVCSIVPGQSDLSIISMKINQSELDQQRLLMKTEESTDPLHSTLNEEKRNRWFRVVANNLKGVRSLFASFAASLHRKHLKEFVLVCARSLSSDGHQTFFCIRYVHHLFAFFFFT